MKYLVIIEKGPASFGAYVPDLPGCVAVAKTRRAVKRLIDQRRFAGKQRDTGSRASRKKLTSAESLVNAYRRESQKQKLLIRKAKICDARLVFIVTAFDKLLGDDNLVNLLRAESVSTMPKYLWAKLGAKHKEAA